MKRLVILLIAIIAVLGAASSTFTVDETQLAIVTQFGKFKRSTSEPGLHFKVPFAETVHFMDGRILGSDTPPAEYLTLDKKRLVADPITRWRITDPLKFFKTVNNEVGAKARLDDVVNSELRQELASHNFGDIVGNERDPMMQVVASKTREKTSEFGIEIIDVRIKRADLPAEVQESVYARMRAERERVAKKYSSEGQEEAAKIRADTDKEKEIILAKADESAKKLRGNGDAEATRIYAEAHNKDPEFYAFSRSLEAYEKLVTKQSALVLSTNSPLFKYLVAPGSARLAKPE